jgi:polysaccharide pyruvyl transferase WcaK-like protein
MRPGFAPDAKIGFISPCGWGNLGDAAIVDSLIHGIRTRLPRARIVGFTLNPSDTRIRHGVDAYTCAAYSLPHYPSLEPSEGVPAPGADGNGGASTGGSALRGLLQRIPLRGSLRTALLAPARLRHEPRHQRLSRERLEGASALVVAGGGQLDDVWGGFLGHPYVLRRWSRIAKQVGASFYVASVGTGTLSAPSRLFVKQALSAADYRSYRDERSRELLREPTLTRNDPIVPDLAYGHPTQAVPAPGKERLVVGVSPMNFGHPKLWPQGEASVYQKHVGTFGELTVRLLEAGHEVVLFSSAIDPEAMEDAAAPAKALPAEARARLHVEEVRTVEGLFDVLAKVDLVVAARLHAVLLAHVAHRPVLAVSHERKVRTLMEQLGHARYCVDISDFEVPAGVALVREIAERRAPLTDEVAAFVAECRGRVERQYDRLFYSQRSTSE